MFSRVDPNPQGRYAITASGLIPALHIDALIFGTGNDGL
jgi:hypothetical protein